MAVEAVFSFDTTGSMGSCIAEVRRNVEKLCADLFKDISGLKIGLIGHGDYCDGPHCINILPLTDNQQKVKDFVKNTPDTSGGDAPECYELVLNKVQDIGWSDGANKIFVMIGDASPHPVGFGMHSYDKNRKAPDWRKELSALKETGVRVYGLKCLENHPTFWQTFATAAGTPMLKLDNFGTSGEIFKGFVYASAGSEAFEKYENSIEILTPETAKHNEILRIESVKFDEKKPVSAEHAWKELHNVVKVTSESSPTTRKRILTPEQKERKNAKERERYWLKKNSKNAAKLISRG